MTEDIKSCFQIHFFNQICVSFCLKQENNICQWVKKKNLNSKGNQDYFALPIGKYLY